MSKPTYTDGDLLIADQDKLRDWEDGECEGIDVLRPATPEEIASALTGEQLLKEMRRRAIAGRKYPHLVNTARLFIELDEGDSSLDHFGGVVQIKLTPEDLEEAGDG